VDLLFPPRCAFCDADLPDMHDSLLLCPPCRDKLATRQWIGCRRCGSKTAAGFLSDGCPRCQQMPRFLDAVVPLGQYQGDLRRAILLMKRPAGDFLSAAMGQLLVSARAEDLAALEPDLVAPVPMHWLRLLWRGTNSPEILARAVAARLDSPLEQGLLTRCRNTLPQSRLKPAERYRNLRGAFRVQKGCALSGARVLLVDDILTTGATCGEAARVLKQAGASYVAAAILGRAEGDT